MGCTPADSVKIAIELDALQDEADRQRYCRKNDVELILLKSSNAPPAILYLAPRNRATLPKGCARAAAARGRVGHGRLRIACGREQERRA